jgi:mono/diheme cytochrome c family protein
MTQRSLILAAAVVLFVAAVVPRAQQPAQPAPAPPPATAGRGAIQSTGGGPGPGAAPAADHPANANADLSPKPPVVPATPEEQAKRFWLPAGYRMTPVLSDPVIQDPAEIRFDGNGRMYVVELRGYFQTPEGHDLIPPIGRISRHEDRNNDGVYEHHSVFVDKLVFPRFAMPLGADAVLTMETNADEVWKYTDTNRDGVADKKDLFTTNFGRAGTMESQPSNLMWAMDNWLYSTVNAFRLRITPSGVLRETTGPNGAQWGVTQDNDGKLFFQHGASGLPGYFQLPVVYGNFPVPDQLEPDLNIVWGAPILIGDIQAGIPGTRLPDGSLIYATAAAGNEVFRGDRLPRDLIGDYIYGDMVGRILRRLRPVKTEGLTQLRNVYPRSEFVRSIDPLFRPADNSTGPDGTLYIADMYRGIIEGAEWAKEGTYLREKIKQYQLDKAMNRGRVWRLTYDGMPRRVTQPRMLNETPAQLVAHLSHPNGWWRDTAQQLIVLKGDKSVVPALTRIARGNPAASAGRAEAAGEGGVLGRVHALWTIEGLGGLTAPLVRELLQDPNPRIRIQAIRVSESLYKAGDRSFASDYRARAADRDTDVAIQAILTMNLLKTQDATAAIQAAKASNQARGVQFVADRILNPPAGRGGRGGVAAATLTPEQQSSLERGETIYNELCFSCHGTDGSGTPQPGGSGHTMAPTLVGSSRVIGHRDYVVKTLLHGLTGPIDGKTYSEVMMPLGGNRDQWVADIASYVRNGFGNAGGFVTTQDVVRVRALTADRRTLWKIDEIDASLPKLLAPDATWKITASHEGAPAAPLANAAGGFSYVSNVAGALTYQGWSTGVAQQPGMWFQIEMPAASMLTEIQFTASTVGGGRAGPVISTFPRGYRVQVSTDGTTWSAAVGEGQGAPGTTIITFPPVSAKFVRITSTVADAAPWAMRNVKLYSAP